MKTVAGAKFKEQCLAALDRVDPEGIVITKRGRPVAKLVPDAADSAGLIDALARIHIWRLLLDVCRAIRSLDFRGDPADEIIAATSLVHGVRLLMRDAHMRRSPQVSLATR